MLNSLFHPMMPQQQPMSEGPMTKPDDEFMARTLGFLGMSPNGMKVPANLGVMNGAWKGPMGQGSPQSSWMPQLNWMHPIGAL